ncbi:hypothetical protein [Paenibacillus pinihumi]|uniref:hypothetical protein n=1 Tax=Paenibacillus pinihumi TaxID=669462 RepID=UPI000416A673|nr:hypothetical protein [Paenibacillus pinihumi]
MSGKREQIAGRGQQVTADDRPAGMTRPESGSGAGREDGGHGVHGNLPAPLSAAPQPSAPLPAQSLTGADPQWQELYAAIRKAVLELRSGS